MASGLTGITQGVKVAVFVIALSVAGIFLYRMVSKDSRPGKTYVVYTRLTDATGLVTKSRVKIAGIPVGYIDTITLDGGRAKVRIVVDDSVDLFHNGATAKRSSSLLGEYNLVIIPGSPEAPKVKDGEE